MAVTHSGVTLAPILGKHVATEVLGDGVAAGALAPYRPTRFPAQRALPEESRVPAPSLPLWC
jgi:glycine/D-amino acid oxidase-like deaminating enzyme